MQQIESTTNTELGTGGLAPDPTLIQSASNIVQNTMPTTSTRPIYDSTQTATFIDCPQPLEEKLSRFVNIRGGKWQSDTAIIPEFLSSAGAPTNEAMLYINSPQCEHRVMEQFKFPQDLLARSPQLRASLMNIAYFKADVVLNIKFVATPYQSGIMYLYQYPFFNTTSYYRIGATSHRRAVTAFPQGISLNLADGTREFEITIPYTNVNQWVRNPDPSAFNMGTVYPNDGLEVFAHINMVPLTKLRGPTNGEYVDYLVSAKFINIKVLGRTPNMSDWHNQIGDVKEPNIGTKISTGLGKVVKIAATAANIIGAVSAGMSKPSANRQAEPVYMHPGLGYTHTEGQDNSVLLDITQKSSIDPSACCPTDDDEMSFEYIANRSICEDVILWHEIDTIGKIIYELDVHPIPIASQAVPNVLQICSANDSTIYSSPIGFVSSFFNYWRGELVLNLGFAKTQFHIGKLLIQYIPVIPYTNTKVSPWESCVSSILDLTNITTSGATFEACPVMQNQWYKVFVPDVAHMSYPGYSAGKIIISVLSPLRSSGQAPDIVDISVWTHWKNFELNLFGHQTRVYPAHERPDTEIQISPGMPMPWGKGGIPIPIPVNSGVLAPLPQDDLVLQAGPDGDQGETGVPTVGCFAVQKDKGRANTTFGSTIRNVRQMTKRFTPCVVSTLTYHTQEPNEPYTAGETFTVVSPQPVPVPWTTTIQPSRSKIGPLNAFLLNNYCLYDQLSFLYGAWKGSVRYKVIHHPDDKDNCHVVMLAGIDEARRGMHALGFGYPSTYVNSSFNNFTEFTIPYATNLEQIPTGFDDRLWKFAYQYNTNFTGPTTPVAIISRHNAVEVQVPPITTLLQKDYSTVLKAAGDDNWFTYLLGAPPFLYGPRVKELKP